MADVSSESDVNVFSAMKVADLKKELKARGLSTSGNKTDLLERLQLAQQGIEGDVNLGETESNAVDSEEMLDEDDVLADEDALEDEIADIDKVEDCIGATSTVKRKIDDAAESAPERKKIVLNRSRPLSNAEKDIENDHETENNPLDLLHTESVVDQHDENKNKSVVKLSSLSAKERLEMRARKFGVTALSNDAKKAARAARFGLQSTNTTVDSDVLKKRAERFGLASSATASEKKVVDDKLKKRQERFGEVKTSNKTKITFDSSAVSSPSSLSNEEKKKLRLERFKVAQ